MCEKTRASRRPRASVRRRSNNNNVDDVCSKPERKASRERNADSSLVGNRMAEKKLVFVDIALETLAVKVVLANRGRCVVNS